MTEGKPFKITKFTTDYVPAEDRIRLTVESAESDVCVLWLTYRMLSRMVPALVELLTEESDQRMKTGQVQAFNQLSAQQKIKQEAAVQAAPSAEQRLITRIDMTPGKEVVNLLFFDENEHAASLSLPQLSLRQWLGVTRELFERASWSTAAWPEWLDSVSLTERTSDQPLH